MSPTPAPNIEATNRRFEEAIATRNVTLLDQVYTTSARLLPPGADLVNGRDNIKSFWTSAIEGLNASGVKLETISFEAHGDTGIEIGRATLSFATPGVAPAAGKYVVIWKVEDGVWKYDADIWNMNG